MAVGDGARGWAPRRGSVGGDWDAGACRALLFWGDGEFGAALDAESDAAGLGIGWTSDLIVNCSAPEVGVRRGRTAGVSSRAAKA